MKFKFLNILLMYLMISIFINTYLCMNNKGKDIPLWKTDSWILGRQHSNPNIDQIGAIGCATKIKSLKVDYNSGKFWNYFY